MTENENENNSPSEPTFTEYLQTQSGLAFLGFFALVLILGSWAAFTSLDNDDAVSNSFEGVSSGFLDVTEAQMKAVEVVDNEVSEEITVTASPSPIDPTVITTD